MNRIWRPFRGAAAILALSAAPLVAGSRPAAPAAPVGTYDTVELAPGVFAFVSTKTGVLSGNSVAIVGDDGAVVVDAGNFPSITRQMIAELRRRTDQPVRFLVITHWHEDHWMGIGEYRTAFPGVVVVSTEFTRERMAKELPAGMQQMIDSGATYAKPYREAIASGRKSDGTPLDDATRKKYEEQIADFEFATAEYKTVVPEMPGLTFEQGIRLRLGKREVQVSFLGRGNTAGDAVVWLPDARILVTGDLVVLPTPFSLGSYPGDWIATLQKLLAYDAAALVSGHGPVQRDGEYVRTLIRLLQSVRAQVGEAVAVGATLEETKRRVHVEEFRSKMAEGNPGLERAFDAYLTTPAVERSYQEAKGSLEPE